MLMLMLLLMLMLFLMFSHAGQNYWMLIDWDRGHFFLIKRAWLLDADLLSTPALNWFPASNGFSKGISETHRFWVWSSHGHFILTWKKFNTQQSAVFWCKSKRIFPTKNVLIRSLKTVRVEMAYGWCRRKHYTELRGLQTESFNFFVLLQVVVIVLQA